MLVPVHDVGFGQRGKRLPRPGATGSSVAAPTSYSRGKVRIPSGDPHGRRGITGPTTWSRPVVLIGLRRSAGAVRPVRATGELQDHGTVDQAVEERRR